MDGVDTQIFVVVVVNRNNNIGKQVLFNHTEFDAFFLLNLFLQLLGKLFIGFICHDGKRVDLKPMNPFAILIHTYTQAAANSLPFFNDGTGFVKRTDLENIGIIPNLLSVPSVKR